MLLRFFFLIIPFLVSHSSYATDYTSHSAISMYKSSYTTYKFFSQAVEGGFGKVVKNKGKEDENARDWKSFNLRSEFGLETLKFFQLSAGLIKTDYYEKGVDSSMMDRYGFFSEMKIVLSAPMMNFEVGGGSTASTLDVVTAEGNAKYLGSGIYYAAVISRYLSSKVAIFGRGSLNQQHYVLDSGNLKESVIDIEDRSVGFGLKLYF